MATHCLGNRDLIPGQYRASWNCDLLYCRFALKSAVQSRITVEKYELVPGPEIEQRTKEPLGVNLDSPAVLVVVAQHDPNAHRGRSGKGSAGKLHQSSHG